MQPKTPSPTHLVPQTYLHQSLLCFDPILTQDDLKKLAVDKVVDDVKPGIVLGLGTRSIAAFVVAKLGHLLLTSQLSNIVGILTSKRTKEQAKPANWVSLSRSSTTTCASIGVKDYLPSVFLPKQSARLQGLDDTIASPTEPYKPWVMGHDHKKQDLPKVQNGAPNNTEFNMFSGSGSCYPIHNRVVFRSHVPTQLIIESGSC